MKLQEDLYDLEDEVPMETWDKVKDIRKEIPTQDLMR